jgi:hypothetical protein
MRDGMSKLLVERPRHGGGVKFQRRARRKWQQIPIDEGPRAEANKERWRQTKGGMKSLNENLAPLMRFLRRRIGRPWDEVYSEICERINRNSAVQLHIWQHLMMAVLLDPRKIEERISDQRRYRAGYWLYVDPQSKLLCEGKAGMTKRVIREGRQSVPWLTVVSGRYYRRIDGLWYEVELAPFPHPTRPAWDAVMRKDTSQVSRGDLQKAYGGCVYAARKRQLGKTEIAALMQALERLGAHSSLARG